MQRISTVCLYIGIVGIVVSTLGFAFNWFQLTTKIHLIGASLSLFSLGLTGLLVRNVTRFFQITSLSLGLFGSTILFLAFNQFLPLNATWTSGIAFISLGLVAAIYSQIKLTSWFGRLLFMQSTLVLILLSMAYLFHFNVRYLFEIGTIEFLIFSVFALFNGMKIPESNVSK